MSIAEPSPITIKYSITLYDLIKCRLWAAAHNRFLWGIQCFGSLLVPLQACNQSPFAGQTTLVKVIMFLLIFAIMFAILAIVQLVVVLLLILLSKNRGVLGWHEMEIRADGLAERTDINESLCRWTGFHKLRKSRHYFFLYVSEHTAHVVPKRAFSSVKEAAEFEALILRLAGRQ